MRETRWVAGIVDNDLVQAAFYGGLTLVLGALVLQPDQAVGYLGGVY
ncbi:hypothetical protein [Streptomyces sp. XY431]|nr:hypothetical protein [Streptomyces sp. XY431]